MKHLFVIAVSMFLAAGCGGTGSKGADPKKAEACASKEKTNPAFSDGDACKKCCGEAGASGHMWMYNDGCKCM